MPFCLLGRSGGFCRFCEPGQPEGLFSGVRHACLDGQKEQGVARQSRGDSWLLELIALSAKHGRDHLCIGFSALAAPAGCVCWEGGQSGTACTALRARPPQVPADHRGCRSHRAGLSVLLPALQAIASFVKGLFPSCSAAWSRRRVCKQGRQHSGCSSVGAPLHFEIHRCSVQGRECPDDDGRMCSAQERGCPQKSVRVL